MAGYRTPEQRALAAEHEVDQLAHKLHDSEKKAEGLLLLVHKLAWIAAFEGVALVLLAYRLVAGGA